MGKIGSALGLVRDLVGNEELRALLREAAKAMRLANEVRRRLDNGVELDEVVSDQALASIEALEARIARVKRGL